MIKMLKSNNNLYLIYEYAADGLDSYSQNYIQLLKSFTHNWRDIARCGVVHGNLRPSSLRFDNKILKIKGFECGRLYDSPFFMPKFIAYSAPEILKGISTQKSDVFSLGLILYKLIYGKLPYPENISSEDLELFWKNN
jgi:serine/threonine-protein kinase ULK/ATG1